MLFLEWKCFDFDLNFTEVYSQESNQQYSSIGSDNGMAPTRRQAIIGTNDDYFTDAYMRHSASMRWKVALNSLKRVQNAHWDLDDVANILLMGTNLCLFMKGNVLFWFQFQNLFQSLFLVAQFTITWHLFSCGLVPALCQVTTRNNVHRGHWHYVDVPGLSELMQHYCKSLCWWRLRS